MTARPALRGQGYMRKGGVAATREHNARVRAAAAAPAPAVVSVPSDLVTDVTDVRASARPGAAARDRWEVALLAVAASPLFAAGVVTVMGR